MNKARGKCVLKPRAWTMSSALLLAVLMLTACEPEQRSVPLVIKNWGPQWTLVGHEVNVQPGGRSAIAIYCSGLSQDPRTQVWFGSFQGEGVSLHEDAVTALVPESVVATAGSYAVTIVEPDGRTTAVGTFTVRGD